MMTARRSFLTRPGFGLRGRREPIRFGRRGEAAPSVAVAAAGAAALGGAAGDALAQLG